MRRQEHAAANRGRDFRAIAQHLGSRCSIAGDRQHVDAERGHAGDREAQRHVIVDVQHVGAQTLIDGEATIEQAGFAVDYLEARHAETLARITSIKDGPVRLLVAAKIGRTRLIDNIAV